MKAPPKPNIIQVWEHFGGTVTSADRGGWRKATCPIHEDSTPSASINEDECRFRCFTCDKSGDALDLIREMTGVSRYPELVALCQKLFGEGDSEVRTERGSSSLLPSRQGAQRKGGTFRPPWTVL